MQIINEPIKVRVDPGVLAGKFGWSSFGYIPTTRQKTDSAIKKFGRYKDEYPVEVAHDIRAATHKAIWTAVKESAFGMEHVPAIICADRKCNEIPLTEEVFTRKKEISLQGASLLVLDSPDFMEIIRNAIALARRGNNFAQALPTKIELAKVVSQHEFKFGKDKRISKVDPILLQTKYYDLAIDQGFRR